MTDTQPSAEERGRHILYRLRLLSGEIVLLSDAIREEARAAEVWIGRGGVNRTKRASARLAVMRQLTSPTQEVRNVNARSG